MPGQGRLFPMVPSSLRAVLQRLTVVNDSDLAYQLGDGTAKVFTFTHNLNSRRYLVEVYSLINAFDVIQVDVTKPTANTVRFDFGDYVPQVNEFEAVIITRNVVPTVVPQAVTPETLAASLTAATRRPSQVELRMMGNRIAQIVETRGDGTKNVITLGYNNDLLVTATHSNPARTYTYTYVNGQCTGWLET